MKLATVAQGARPHPALVLDDGCYLLLDQAWELLTGDPSDSLASMLAIIDGGQAALDQVHRLREAVPAEAIADPSDVRVLAPLPEPRQIRDYGCFPDHFRNAFSRVRGVRPEDIELPQVYLDRPLHYLVNRLAVVGQDADIEWPSFSSVRDYELEFACVLGRGGRDIAVDDADAHIFGYTIFNDFTARDTQAEEIASGLGMSKCKDFDASNSLGPWIVTADELTDPYQLDMTARINGTEVSRGTSAGMHHRFADMIAFTSVSTTLHAGEVLCSGTVPTGCGLETGHYLQPGDVIELEVSGIGVLRNRVIS
jgi:2-keto-4-pentenoate hydratase/2-oxohepta-3-ene-1,7-dioic acid hydratase in catechol pathway